MGNRSGRFRFSNGVEPTKNESDHRFGGQSSERSSGRNSEGFNRGNSVKTSENSNRSSVKKNQNKNGNPLPGNGVTIRKDNLDTKPPDSRPSFHNGSNNYFSNSIPANYLPARSKKYRSKETVRKARLAEPEPSISDLSDSLSAPPSPPIPSESVHLSPLILRRRDSYASAVDVYPEFNSDKIYAALVIEPVSEPSPKWIQTDESGQLSKTGGFFGFGQDLLKRHLTSRSVSGAGVSSNLTYPTAMDAMKWAFYNVSVFTMAVCSVFGALAAYFLFYEFVKPAMWAAICGIVLYPLKRQLTGVVRRWLDHLNENGKPLTFAIAALPLDVTNQLGEFLLDSMTNNLKMVLLMVAAFPMSALILHFETIPRSLVTAKQFLLFVDHGVAVFNGKWVPILLLTYLSYICLSNIFHRFRNPYLCHICISWTIWSAGVAYGCNYFGPFRTPIFAALFIICCTYYVPLFGAVNSTKKAFNRLNRRSTKKRTQQRSGNRDGSVRELKGLDEQSMAHSPATEASVDDQQKSVDSAGEENESNTYLKRLFIACFFVYVSLHLWIVFLLILPIGVAVARRIVVKFDICALIERNWTNLKSKLGGDAALLFPAPFLHIFRVLLHIDRQIIYYLRQSMDLVGSLTAMVLLVILVASLAGFVMFQLYYESMHLINLTADIANQTLTKSPGLQKWLRQTVHVDSVTELANEAVQRAYGMSRNWLSAQMHEIVQNDPEKAKLLESQIVTTLDTFFHNWLSSRNASNQTALANPSHRTAISQWADIWTALGESGGELDWNVFDNLHEYISLILSVADSAWMILKNNMEILMVGFSQIASTLLASGTAVVDFFLDLIVFLTFLMYLLSESDEEYKPLKMIRDLVPSGQDTASKITDEAVNGVFLATSKMAIFYGMFTWLTHTLFAVNLVFIPSVLAAAFAAIPFFGTYLVALPAILELWLIRGEPFLAVLLFVLHYIPSYVVDDAIYSDIRLTTPLLSGMAIAGGMLWWGLEGAIFGPLVLCCILVLGGVYKTIFFKTMTSSGSVSSKESSVNEAHVVHTNGDVKHD